MQIIVKFIYFLNILLKQFMLQGIVTPPFFLI